MAHGSPDLHDFVTDFSGDHRYVIDYLVEEVLNRQPERVQTFLLQTAILDRLSGPLCEAVTGLSQGEGLAMLELLERGNLFTTPLDNQRRWYRYHYLFAGCLRTRLDRLPRDQVPELHRRACAWYVEEGMTSEAVHHALAASAPELAADLIERTAPATLNRGEAVRFLGWLRALPGEMVRDRPRLCVSYAKALLLTGQLDAASAALQDAERSLGGAANDLRRVTAVPPIDERAIAEQILIDVLTLRATIASKRRDSALTITLSNQALSLSAELDAARTGPILHNLGNAHRWSGDMAKACEALAEAATMCRSAGRVLIAILASTQLANAQAKLGRLRQAADTYQQVRQYVADQGLPLFPEAAWAGLGLASIYFEWNELTTAAQYADDGLRLANYGGLTDARLSGAGVQARLKQAQGDLDGALEILRSAEQLARANNLRHELTKVREYQARLWLNQGNLGAAIDWACALGLTVEDESNYLREAEYLTLVRVLIAQDKAGETLPLLQRMLGNAEAAGRRGSTIKILTIHTLVMQSIGQVPEALLALERALRLAEPEAYVRTFLEAGKRIVPLLAKLLEARQRGRNSTDHGVSPGYVHALLTALQTGDSSCLSEWRRAGCAFVSEALSERELEVLRLIANGRSPLEIARDLVLSLNTIKTHLKRIYGKLDAHSGTEAVAKARQMRLV